MEKENHETGQIVLHHGFLVKSPPTHRWLSRWRKRWFVLKRSSELPGQYCLEYYVDKECKKLKGRIDLDQCEQVETGLRYKSKKQKCQYMFSVKTPERIYYFLSETEAETYRWVDVICRECKLIYYPEGPTDSDSPPVKFAIESTPNSSPLTIHDYDYDDDDDDDDDALILDKQEKDVQKDKADEMYYVDIHHIAKSLNKSPNIKYLEVTFDESNIGSTGQFSPSFTTSYTAIDPVKTIALGKAKQLAEKEKKRQN